MSKDVQHNRTDSVKPIDWSRFKKDTTQDGASLRLKHILLNAIRYNFTVWYAEKFASQTGEYLDLGGIRPPVCAALALATAVRFGIYDASVAGLTEKEAVKRAVRIIASAAYSHKANTPKGWGNDWQTAMWANLAGTAAWLLWDELSATDRELVRKMVEYEADRFLTYEVPYCVDDSGNIKYRGDTKAEENAWNSGVLQLATAMMPDHVNRNVWMDKNIELMISAYARPDDLASTKMLHGRQVKDWLKGSNAYDEGTVVNHSIIHPDYMTSIGQVVNAPFPYTLAGMTTPAAALFNADYVYKSLVDLNFKSPPYRAPGGTIYQDGSPDIYYPQGNDWGTHRRMNFAMIDVYADVLGFDNLVTQKGAYWERYHDQMVLDMQSRHADGRTYSARSEDTNAGREQWVALLAARAYEAMWLKHQHKMTFSNEPYTCLWPAGWKGESIGGAAGSCRYSGNRFKIEGAGSIKGAADKVKYIYRQIRGDATISVRIDSMEGADEKAIAGIMFRADLDDDAQEICIGYTAAGRISISYRSKKGEDTHREEIPIAAGHHLPVRLKLERRGGEIKGYYAPDGVQWKLVATRVITADPVDEGNSMGLMTVPDQANTSQDRRTIRYTDPYEPSRISGAVFSFVHIND
ncbi:hypothetical protein [Compostibacter hankyongensis]|uniref:Uncharacterized protein n=1 Tax=Compostibacter hankyongensis TaxID=1007089 RepID=A0ABP8FHH7_9BACT